MNVSFITILLSFVFPCFHNQQLKAPGDMRKLCESTTEEPTKALFFPSSHTHTCKHTHTHMHTHTHTHTQTHTHTHNTHTHTHTHTR